jgi:predicted Zn-dependent peptidase
MFAAYASVKAVHTADSLAEFLKEIEAALGAKPLAQGEFEAGQSGLLQGFPGRFEGLSGVMGQYGSADALQRPENWVAGFPGRVAAVDLAQAQQALSEVVSASDLVIVIVGDHAAHGAAVAELGISPITLVDDAATPVE